MVHHSKDKVPRKLMDMYPQSLVDWIGKNYEVIECKSPVIMDSDGNEGIADGLITVIKRLPEGIEKTENLPFIFNPEIQSSWVTPKILIRSHGYCNKACLQYGMPVEPFFISTVELKSRKASVEIVKGEKFTADVLSLTEMDADKRLNRISKKLENNEELIPYDFFDLAFLPFMTSKKHSQVKLYSISLKICAQGVKETEDKVGIRDILDWYFEDLIKTREDYELIKGDLMNDIRAMYIQDEKEESKKEGIKEGEIKGEIKGIKKGKIEGKMEERKQVITNMLNETDDINFIHKMTKYPRSEIINVAKLASINIKI